MRTLFHGKPNKWTDMPRAMIWLETELCRIPQGPLLPAIVSAYLIIHIPNIYTFPASYTSINICHTPALAAPGHVLQLPTVSQFTEMYILR